MDPGLSRVCFPNRHVVGIGYESIGSQQCCSKGRHLFAIRVKQECLGDSLLLVEDRNDIDTFAFCPEQTDTLSFPLPDDRSPCRKSILEQQ